MQHMLGILTGITEVLVLLAGFVAMLLAAASAVL